VQKGGLYWGGAFFDEILKKNNAQQIQINKIIIIFALETCHHQN
jgi:hypothetical protein